jgi:hypothetical protein
MKLEFMQIFKKILIFSSIALAILLILISITYIIYGDKFCNILVNEINKNIETEITTKNSKLSLFKNFPNISITFYNVNIKSLKGFSLTHCDSINSKNTLTAEEITIRFNVIQLLFKNVIISGLEVKNGKLILLTNNSNKSNYSFWKKNLHTGDKKMLQINKIVLKKIKIIYYNEKKIIYINTSISKLYLRGQLGPTRFNVNFYSSINQLDIFSPEIKYNLNSLLDISFFVKHDNHRIRLDNGNLRIFNQEIKFRGEMFDSDPFDYILSIVSNRFKVNCLNEIVKKYIKDFKFNKGKLDLDCNLSGSIKEPLSKGFNAKVKFIDVSSDYKKEHIDHFSAELSVLGKSNDFSKYEYALKNAKGFYKNSTFNIALFEYNKYFGTYNLNGNLNIKTDDISNYINNGNIKFSGGSSNFHFKLKNIRIKQFDKNFFNSVKFEELKLELNNINCSYLGNNYKFENTSGAINLSGKSLEFLELQSTINGNKISFKGEIENCINSFQESKNFKINGRLNGKILNLNNFNFASNGSTNSAKLEFSFEPNLKLEFDSLVYNNILISSFKARLHYLNNKFKIENINARICKGYIKEGYSEIINSNDLTISSNCTLKDIDIQNLFYSFNNFGQDIITSNNIKGIVSGIIKCDLKWKNGNLSKENIYCNSNLNIEKGELINFQPIKKLSKFIDVMELNDIKFKRISNKIILEHNIIKISSMEINTTALNLTLSGTHSLDNEYEYHFKVLLSDLLYNKSKKNESAAKEFSNVEKDTLGRIVLYIKIVGKGYESNTSYDSKQAMNGFSDKLKKEKKEIKKIFKEEFGFSKDDSLSKQKIEYRRKKFNIESEEIKKEVPQNKQGAKTVKKKKMDKIEWKDE